MHKNSSDWSGTTGDKQIALNISKQLWEIDTLATTWSPRREIQLYQTRSRKADAK